MIVVRSSIRTPGRLVSLGLPARPADLEPISRFGRQSHGHVPSATMHGAAPWSIRPEREMGSRSAGLRAITAAPSYTGAELCGCWSPALQASGPSPWAESAGMTPPRRRLDRDGRRRDGVKFLSAQLSAITDSGAQRRNLRLLFRFLLLLVLMVVTYSVLFHVIMVE